MYNLRCQSFGTSYSPHRNAITNPSCCLRPRGLSAAWCHRPFCVALHFPLTIYYRHHLLTNHFLIILVHYFLFIQHLSKIFYKHGNGWRGFHSASETSSRLRPPIRSAFSIRTSRYINMITITKYHAMTYRSVCGRFLDWTAEDAIDHSVALYRNDCARPLFRVVGYLNKYKFALWCWSNYTIKQMALKLMALDILFVINN